MKTIDDEILAAMLKDLDDMTDEELKDSLCNMDGDIRYAFSGTNESGYLKDQLEKS